MAQLLLKRSSYCAAVDERSRAAAPLDATTFAAGVRRLARAAELKGHSGCVNTAMWLDGGRAVLTGSDDTHIGFATAQRSSMRLLPTPHEANIFCVRPVGNSSSGGSSMPTELASSALDGKVIHYHISSTGDVRASKVLHEHNAGANNLTVCPADPRIWLSCGGDGRVCRFDTRVGAAGGGVLISGARSAEMLRLSRRAGSYGGMTIGLHSVGYNPIAPHEFFAVGADPVTRIFDVRNLSQPVASYCPLHLRKDGRWEAGRKARGRHLPCDWVKHQRKHAETTGAQWSQDGSALVSTLTNSQIYTFQHRPTAQRPQSVLLAAGSGYDLRFKAPAPPAAGASMSVGASAVETTSTTRAPATARAASSRAPAVSASPCASHADSVGGVKRPRGAVGGDCLPTAPVGHAPTCAADRACIGASVGGGRFARRWTLHPPPPYVPALTADVGGGADASATTSTFVADDDCDGSLCQLSSRCQRGALGMRCGCTVCCADADTCSNAADLYGEPSLPAAATSAVDADAGCGGAAPAAAAADDAVAGVAVAAGDKPTGDAFAYRPGQVAFPLISTASIADADSAGTCPGFGDHELSGEPGLKTEVACCEHEDPEGTIQGWYTGHEHTRTIKAVSFWGPRDEYIVTGCDSGRLCVYDRYTSEKVFLAEADRAGPLNAVCRHPDPLVPMLLTCGLEDSAHVWAPVRWHSLLRFPVGRASVKDLTTGISRSPYTYAATADVEFDMAQCVGEPPEGDEDGEFGRITRTMRMVDPAVYAEEAAQLAEDLFGDGLTSTSSESSSWDDSDDEEVEDEDEDEEGSDGELGSQDIDDSHGDLHDTRWPLDTSDGEGAMSSSGASGSSSRL